MAAYRTTEVVYELRCLYSMVYKKSSVANTMPQHVIRYSFTQAKSPPRGLLKKVLIILWCCPEIEPDQLDYYYYVYLKQKNKM